MIFLFLTSGLFLGWSLGANDAANVFGTAVGTRMIRFKTAALIASVFVIIGAVIGGSGAAYTLGKLGAVNAIAGSFMVALASGLTVFLMTRLKVPVSTSQAIVGGIVGWNFFTSSVTDYDSLTKIVLTWFLCPVLAAIFAILLFSLLKLILNNLHFHMLSSDNYLRIALTIAGAFGAYSLGANNIANVMGVFVPVTPFEPLDVYGLFTLSSAQQLFFLGGLAIAVGIFTYSQRVMATVGKNLFRLSPISALVVVLSQAIVLFLFSSEQLESWLFQQGLPTIPLVPVSSTQAVVGAIIGIGLIKGGKGVRYNVLGEIATGWVTTPVISGIITFVALFFLQNVFNQQVSRKTEYIITQEVLTSLQTKGINDPDLLKLQGRIYHNSVKLSSTLKRLTSLDNLQIRETIDASEISALFIDPLTLNKKLDRNLFSDAQIEALKRLEGERYRYKWQFIDALENQTDEWRLKPDSRINKEYNKSQLNARQYLINLFQSAELDEEEF
ncbi:MAG: inorganic phosphate transporter [Calditrichaceae bacterium]